MIANKNATAWSVQEAVAAYNIDNWGAGYFSVNETGNICVSPLQGNGATLAMMDVLQEAQSRGLAMPLLIRFHDLLRHRVVAVNEGFRVAAAESGYQGRYYGVFPIKVNQLCEVVEEIIDAGEPYHYGLEVGSKPELFAAMAVYQDPEGLIVCNGYKDASYVRMALAGCRLGKRIILVVEKLEEMGQIIAMAREMNVSPSVGVRIRLLSKGAGKWAESGGENAKFGLTTAELLEAVELLKQAGMERCLKLVHFHIGSQVPDIAIIKRAVREGARYYAKLRQMGYELEFLDVGGGLGVDYDGSRSSSDSSTNYSMQEYTSAVVYAVQEVCDAEKVPHPHLVSESGRAVVAHHSVLIVDLFGSIQKDRQLSVLFPEKGDVRVVAQLFEIHNSLNKRNRRESLHNARELKEEAQTMFDLGLLDLRMKAKVEMLYWQIARQVVNLYQGAKVIPEEIIELEKEVSDQYLCNFSVFQSLLDHWALGQLFPIVPIHRLNEMPNREGILVDITCDSEGKIGKFIDVEGVREMLPLHAINQKPYYVGIFLVGAYQDTMGDLHNLFGRVNEIHVYLDPDEESGYYIEEVIEGSTMAHVLATIQYDSNELVSKMKMQVDQAIKEDRVKPNEGMRLLAEYEKGLKNYTYLDFNRGQEKAPNGTTQVV
ncbi:MAG: biosynthetic arginine decarboxylase [Verrucomicrobiae bacterium]|nr:biosynthetic arginine decarboxylase [Verrucomicrobiae bacterium]